MRTSWRSSAVFSGPGVSSEARITSSAAACCATCRPASRNGRIWRTAAIRSAGASFAAVSGTSTSRAMASTGCARTPPPAAGTATPRGSGRAPSRDVRGCAPRASRAASAARTALPVSCSSASCCPSTFASDSQSPRASSTFASARSALAWPGAARSTSRYVTAAPSRSTSFCSWICAASSSRLALAGASVSRAARRRNDASSSLQSATWVARSSRFDSASRSSGASCSTLR